MRRDLSSNTFDAVQLCVIIKREDHKSDNTRDDGEGIHMHKTKIKFLNVTIKTL